eukprot:9406645-Pyramimonas_sp.AAC.1
MPKRLQRNTPIALQFAVYNDLAYLRCHSSQSSGQRSRTRPREGPTMHLPWPFTRGLKWRMSFLSSPIPLDDTEALTAPQESTIPERTLRSPIHVFTMADVSEVAVLSVASKASP